MFIFYFLGVGPPRRSIFCQLWLCEEAQCVYLRRYLGSPPHLLFQQDIYCLSHKPPNPGAIFTITDAA